MKSKNYLILMIFCIIFSFLSPTFLTSQNIINILLASSIIGILALASSFVICSSGLDLSIGSTTAFCAAMISLVMFKTSLTFVLFFGCFSGLLAGYFNGIFITKLKIPPFIATLGMLGVLRGIALIITDGRPVYDLPENLTYIGQGEIYNIPVPIIIFFIIGIICKIILSKTRFGLHLLCIGDNEQSSFNVGIQVNKIKIMVYMFSGLLSSIAGIILIGRINAVDPAIGNMYELTAITACIIGGTNLSGGKTSIIGTIVGAIIISVLQNGLTLLAIQSYYQQVSIGVLLIFTIYIDQVFNK